MLSIKKESFLRKSISYWHLLLDKKIKIKFWEQAQKEKQNQLGQKGMIKFRYAQLALEYFNQHGESFSKEMIELLCFVNGLVEDIGF